VAAATSSAEPRGIPKSVARPGERNENRALTQVMPEGQVVEVAGDVVDVRVRPSQDLLHRQPPGIRGGRPQSEPDGHREDGHRLIVGVVIHLGGAVA